jgi:exopolyphosphatase/guanosine-5'-triphosphate,3'-diphosphate pyrophosphatase
MGEMRGRYAALDFGTNSLRMLIADLDSLGEMHFVTQKMQITRLGRDLGSKGIISPLAIADSLEVAGKFVQEARDLGAKQIYAVATSAVRDAQNRGEFLTAVRKQTGLNLEVISGEKEAELTYLGVQSVLKELGNPLVIDLGGGSTEFIWKEFGGGLSFISLDLGAVRMTEAYLSCDPVDDGQLKLLRTGVRNLIEFKLADVVLPQTILGVGGTVTSLAAVDQELKQYCREKVHGYRLSLERVEQLLERFKQLPLRERKNIVGLQSTRADIIIAGTAILAEIMSFIRAKEVIISESDILQGIILDRLANVRR